MPNERIVFTTFVSQQVPAVARWQEREEDALASLVDVDATPLAGLTGRLRTETPKLAPPLGSIAGRPVTMPQRFNQSFTVWRLISANNREMARAAGMFSDYAEAAAHAQRVKDAAAVLTVTPIRRAETRDYGWYASFGECPVLLSAVWHRSPRDRDRSALGALQALVEAKILATAVRHGQRHLAGIPAPIDQQLDKILGQASP